MKKTKAEMNKPVYIAASRLDISKTLVFEFWYDYMNQKMETEQNRVTY